MKHDTLQIVGRLAALIGALALGWGRVSLASDQTDQDAEVAETDAAQPDESERLEHAPRRHAPPPGRDVHEGDPWLARTSHDVKDWFQERGITYDLFAGIFYQHADDVVTGDSGLWTLNYQLTASWALTKDDRLGSGRLGTTVLGSIGLGYDPEDETLTGNAGVISDLDGSLYPDPIVVDELFWGQAFPDDAFSVKAGVLDFSSWFDTNRVANDGFRQFIGGPLQNNLSIPFPTYGGFAGLLRWKASDELYILAGIADSRSNEGEAPWKSARADSLYQLVEVGLTVDIEGFGEGVYRFIPWHSSLEGTSGWGFGVSFDQELGSDDLLGFFRFGVGDQDVTSVGTFVSGGLGFNRPFERTGDMIGVGVSWSDPASGSGSRQETALELLYRLEITPHLELTPDLQVIFDPAQNPDTNTIWVAGVRLAARF
ncbi:MAG: carbohydrate porin [Planctomycetota bacterium]